MSPNLAAVYADSSSLRATTQEMFTPERLAVEDRLDELQASIANKRWQVWFGHEIEFRLRPLVPGGECPDKERFYEEVIQALYPYDGFPPEIPKGQVLLPGRNPGPVLMNPNRMGTYNPDQPDSSIIEIRTAPAEWREAEARYWETLRTIDELAAKYGSRAEIGSTHQSTVATRLSNTGYHHNIEHNTIHSRVLKGIQLARRVLQPYETYAGLALGHDSYPTKAARWTLHDARIESRYPALGVIDPLVGMLGALAGVDYELEHGFAQDDSSLHSCQTLDLYSSKHPEWGALSNVMVWDETSLRMVLPKRMTRPAVVAAARRQSADGLDKMVRQLTGDRTADFSANNARVLRQLVGPLWVNDEGRIEADTTERYGAKWSSYLEGLDVFVRPAVRIVAKSPYAEPRNYTASREQANASPLVAGFLGQRLLRALTSAPTAYAMQSSLPRPSVGHSRQAKPSGPTRRPRTNRSRA